MKKTAVLLALALTFPALAAVGPDVTLPVAGHVVLADRTYRTELTVSNHRDVEQYVAVQFINGQAAFTMSTFLLEPHTSIFVSGNQAKGFTTGSTPGALRFLALTNAWGAAHEGNADPDPLAFIDPAGRIEAKGYIINERGPFGIHGSSRQEVESVGSDEYRTKENAFVGVEHNSPTYTNVGIVNLDPARTVTFYVQFQYLEPVAVTVAPLTSQQIRITGGVRQGVEGSGGNYVIVTPEWAGDASGLTTPWVAYASTVDGFTGDAFSAVRIPAGARLQRR